VLSFSSSYCAQRSAYSGESLSPAPKELQGREEMRRVVLVGFRWGIDALY
jgi:hypothetical protein